MKLAYLFTAVELIGTVAFALSGAMTALKYRLDLFGVLFLGVTVATGGGMVRDVLIGNLPPLAFRDYTYLLTAALTSLLAFLAAYFSKGRYHTHETKVESLANVFDALGLGAFSVTGVLAGINAGFGDNSFLLVFLGMLTGIGGGILRDVFVQRMPNVLHKHVYALPCILGACLYLLLYRLHVSHLIGAFASVALVFTLRMLATKFRWNLPRAE